MADSTPKWSRRTMLAGGLSAAGGAAAGGTATLLLPNGSESDNATPAIEPFHGEHQAGITTPPQSHAAFVSLELKPDVSADRFVAVQRLLSQDAERLTQGEAALGDTEPDLVRPVNRLTITFGFGYELFDKLELTDRRPGDFTVLPEFEVDRLEAGWSGGDLLLQICADDATTIAHAVRMCVKDARAVAEVKWIMRGFRQAPPVIPAGATPRNLMGQLDGTSNLEPGETDFDDMVWRQDANETTKDGTILVLRRIRAEMETWDEVPAVSKELTVGRKLDTGAPLTGEREHDEPDFDATDDLDLPVIAPNAHIRRARLADGRRIFRRAYNYDDQLAADGTGDSGLIFASYQADMDTFVDMQSQLDSADMLNSWITPIGSAQFLIPPGCQPGGWIGETLFD